MVSLEKDEREAFKSTLDFNGLSTDEKPTEYHGKPLANGSTFMEMDTVTLYFWDETNKQWLEA